MSSHIPNLPPSFESSPVSLFRARTPRILVVDDQPINIKLLQRKLEKEGYSVRTAATGYEALTMVYQQRPDLILLDVMMPEMNGIETCQKLKESDDTADIPIIFITAKSSKEGKIEGLGAGAVDYITKPIDLDETMARVKTQLRIQEVYRDNVELQRRLGESRRNAAIGAITQGIAHNLNNLLGVVVGYLDLLKSGFDSPDMVQRSVSLMDQAIQRMVNIIRHLSKIASSERVELTENSLSHLIETSIDRFRSEMETKAPIDVFLGTPKDLVLPSNAEMFEGVMSRLLTNALEAYPRSKPDEEKRIEITTEEMTDDDGNEFVLIRILDRGVGISPSIIDNIFEPFITTKTSVGRGLGLTMARHALRNLRGDLRVTNRDNGGAIATVFHPKSPASVPYDSEMPFMTRMGEHRHPNDLPGNAF